MTRPGFPMKVLVAEDNQASRDLLTCLLREWGYDLVHHQLRPPSQYVDLMSYCEPIWISDYNYQNLFSRIQYVNGAARIYQPPETRAAQSYERLSVAPDGTISWHQPLQTHGPLGGDPTQVNVVAGGQTVELEGYWYRYSHLPGGLLLFPQATVRPSLATWRIDGKLRTASRSQLTSRALTHKSR